MLSHSFGPRTVPCQVKHRSAKAKPPRSGGPKECQAIQPMRGGRVQACRRSERWRVFGRGRIEEVWRCARRFERAVTRSCCSVMTGMAQARFAVVVARSLSARQLPRLRRSRRVLPRCSDSVAMGAIADVADARSRATMWNEFFPISMPTHGDRVLSCCCGHSVLLVWAPLTSLSLAGQEHGRTIPLTDVAYGRADPLSMLGMAAKC